MRFINSSAKTRRWIGLVLGLYLAQSASARDVSVASNFSGQSLAFARYIASVNERDLFSESGPVLVMIHASLPGLYKESDMLAIRWTGEEERNEYGVLYMEGDGTAGQAVIERYFEMERQLEDRPLSSILVTPANYKFHFRGEVSTVDNSAYVYDIAPRKARTGLVKGQLWMDAATGVELLLKGRLTGAGDADFVRETELLDGKPVARLTHLSFTLPILGRGELVVTEYPLASMNEKEIPPAYPRAEHSNPGIRTPICDLQVPGPSAL